MAPIRHAVRLGGGEFVKVSPLGENGPMSAVVAVLSPLAAALFDDLVWWAQALKTARGR